METSRTYAWLRAHPFATDAMIAGLLTLVFALPYVELGAGAALVCAVTTVAVAWRRQRPLPSALVVAAGCAGQLWAHPATPLPAAAVGLYAVYSAAAHLPSRAGRRWVLALALAGSVLGIAVWSSAGTPLGARALAVIAVQTGLVWLVVVMAYALGSLVRGREAMVSRLRSQNDALRRDREQRDLIAAQHERARIAREMHDIVAHSLSVIVVQADGGAYAAAHSSSWDTERTVDTLQTVARTAREALAETRRLVGVLREPDDAGTDDSSVGGTRRTAHTAPTAPTSGLTGLPELLARVRSAGVTIDDQVDHAAAQRISAGPRETDLAVYRVIQESLTNVLKHAGPTPSVRLVLRPSGPGTLVQVLDDGGGNGLAGMRERVTRLGGTFQAGPRPGGGFGVTATFPDSTTKDTPT